MKLGCPFCSIILLLIFILLSKDELTNVNALIIENNPFYGLSNAKIKTVEFTTDDNLINVKLEYAPQAFKIGSPEFFKATLSYKDTNEIALHADTDIVISKDGKELFKESSGYSKPYVHTPNETANFVGIIGQMQAELELVPTNLANNNVSLAQNHASKADSLLTPRILVEIAEDNPRLAGDLRSAMIHLQSISSSSESQIKNVSQLVNDLNKRLGEDANVRMAQVQPSSSNPLEGAMNFLGNIFGGSSTEVKDQDAKLEALALANVIDGVLINYGSAYHVGFDMTNMSNMVMIGNNNSPSSMVINNPVTGNNSGTSNMNMNMNMQSKNTSSNTMTSTEHGGKMNTGYSLVNVSDYQSAQALAAKASEIFNTKLKQTTMSNNKNATAFVTHLENGLTQLNKSISSKASPRRYDDSSHTNSS